MVLSVRLRRELFLQLDHLAEEMERSRANLLARAVREYIEREHANLEDIRAGEADIASGRTVSNEDVSAWVDDLLAGKRDRPAFAKP